MNKDNLKKVGLEFVKYVGTVVVPIIVAALLKGESLTGLAKIKPFLHFLTTGIPLWLFLSLLILCVWMIPSVVRARRPSQPKLHVSWERIACIWALGKFGDTPMMQIQGQAVISSSNTDDRIILREGYVKGTKPLMNLADAIQVVSGQPLPCRIITFVAPVIRKPNEDLEAELILVDHKGRKYKTEKTTFKSGNPQMSAARVETPK